MGGVLTETVWSDLMFDLLNCHYFTTPLPLIHYHIGVGQLEDGRLGGDGKV
jgi:hypothetical protein